MTKWDYTSVYIVSGKVYAVNDQAVKSPSNVGAVSYFNQLGAQGWEMVSVISSSDVNHYLVLFKHPVSPAP